MIQRFRRPSWVLAPVLALACTAPAPAAERDPVDTRARVVEFSLRDLSEQNAKAAPSIIESPTPADCPLCGERVRLPDRPAPVLPVGAEVTSSLHRLRREAVLGQADEDREVQVEQALRSLGDPE